MPRRYRPPKRKVSPDIKYNSEQVEMCINRVMKWGKKSTARGIMYDALAIIEDRTKRPPLQTFEQALKNATPLVEVKPRRVGGATYQIPVEVSPDRRVALALRWLIASARSRSGKSMAENLAAELMDAANNVGTTVKKREDTHRMAEANKAYAMFRW
ncbi:MAG: 30S ribosomal protein S7 [Anaerolineae bacterium]|nr:30S ribosomal protein S7 [Anaerolineae bacterium]